MCVDKHVCNYTTYISVYIYNISIHAIYAVIRVVHWLVYSGLWVVAMFRMVSGLLGRVGFGEGWVKDGLRVGFRLVSCRCTVQFSMYLANSPTPPVYFEPMSSFFDWILRVPACYATYLYAHWYILAFQHNPTSC